MYRTKQRMEREASEAQEGNLNSEFIKEVTQLPVVNVAWDYAANTYGRIKEHNKLFNYTLSTAEKSVLFAAEQAKPVVQKFEKQLHAVDEFALKGLYKLEETAPIIKKSPDEIFNETKKLYSSTVQSGVDKYEGLKTYGTERVKSAKDYSINKAASLLTNPYGLHLVRSVDGALTLTESCVDYYFPALDEENEKHNLDRKEAVEEVVEKVGRLSSKMRRRIYKHALIHLHNLQKLSQDSLGKLNSTVDLIQYARDNLTLTNQKVHSTIESVQNNATWLWNELNKEEQESNAEKNWEQQLLSVARQLTKQMVKTYNQTTSAIQLLPDNVQQRLSVARDYSVELYGQFSKVTHLDDVTNVMLNQMQQKVKFIEETFGTYFEAVLNSQPLSWLVPNNKDSSSNNTETEMTQQKEH